MKINNCIYRFINKEDEIIYIGKAKCLKQRLGNHTHLPKECYDEICNIEFAIFNTEDDMDFAERYYIPKLKPRYNDIWSNREMTFDIPELDNVQWILYGEDECIYEQIKLSEIHLKKIKDINIKIETMKRESSNIKSQIEEIRRSGIFDYSELAHKENIINKKIEKLKRDLLVLKIPKRTIMELEEWEIELFVKYETYTKEDTLNMIISEIQDEYLKKCFKEIEVDGYYNYEELLYGIHRNFTYNPYVYNREWLKWIDDIPKWKNRGEKHIEVANKVIFEVEFNIINTYGKCYQTTVITNKNYLDITDIHIPQATLVKKVMSV